MTEANVIHDGGRVTDDGVCRIAKDPGSAESVTDEPVLQIASTGDAFPTPVSVNRYSRFDEVELTYKVATDDGRVLFQKSIVITHENLEAAEQLENEAYDYYFALDDDDSSDLYRYFNGKPVNCGYRLEACPWCSILFFVRGRHGTKHCSKKCSSKAKTTKQSLKRKADRQSALSPRPCDHCGEIFTPKRKDALFCSAKCRVAAKRKRDKQTASTSDQQAGNK